VGRREDHGADGACVKHPDIDATLVDRNSDRFHPEPGADHVIVVVSRIFDRDAPDPGFGQ
jgi:hypothetical protein